jgi:tetratricopeptide (TPR) repeat protein
MEFKPNLFKDRGVVKMNIGDNQGALEDFTKAIELDHKDGYSYWGRGLVKQKIGNNEGACQDFKKAKELGLDNVAEAIDEFCK